ncbi:MAG: hypothetical protein CMO47_00575 [Verrucomicrobiales bacterium]|nr:hypothetical protein [Verrucomicrobiales bacterium]
MSRATEEFLAGIHGLVATQIRELLQSPDPRDVKEGIAMGMKFLRDNSITATVDTSPDLSSLNALMPTTEELEKLMTATPN